MKSYFFTAVCWLICFYCSAQITHGTKFAGINLNLNGANNSNQTENYHFRQKSWSIGLNPEYASFVKDNFALGLGLSFNYGENRSTSDYTDSHSNSKTINSSYSIRPFIRNYKMFGQKFGIFLQSGFNVSIGKQKNNSSNDEGTTENQYNTLGLGVSTGPGMVYFVSKKWVIEAATGSAGLYYSSSKSKNENGTSKNTNFGLDFNLGLNYWSLGLKYYF